MADYLVKRGGYWIYRRRVPAEFSELDPRAFVKLATRIRISDDPRGIAAGRIVDRLNAETEAYWRGLSDGQAAEARRRYDAARRRARTLGFSYMPADKLGQDGDTGDIVSRIKLLVGTRAVDSETEVAAVLGGEVVPEIKLSELFETYEKVTQLDRTGMSADQLRKWRNPKKRAIDNLLKVIDDKPIAAITRDDALDFRAWWQDRIVQENMQADTANKDFGHMSRMLRTLDMQRRLGLTPVFDKLQFERGNGDLRISFDTAFLQERLLREGALDGLNDQARAVVYLMVETGLRVSEACNAVFRLDFEIPYVQVLAEGRRTKTPQSVRDIPLVGVSLMVAKAFPDGFERYRHKADGLSALVNKYLGGHALRPSIGHTLYSLRHSFEDRLTAVEPPDKIQAALMGHKYYRPRYGTGPSLAQKKTWLDRIVLDPPARI